MRHRKAKRQSDPTNPLSVSGLKKAALLESLGRSPDEHPVFSLPSPLLPWGGVFAAILITFLAPPLIKDGPVGVVLAAALMLATLVIMLIPRKLFVGEDGLLLVWMLGSRFIPFRDIDHVETTEGFFFRHPGIDVALKNGHALDFCTSLFKERWAERDALLLLLRACLESAKSKRVPATMGSLLRAGKPHAAWARALLAMGHGARVDPRTPAVLPEDLLAIAECTDASAIERTAAFVALSAKGEASFEKRLRVAAEHTVAPHVQSSLREALDAGEDEARIARLLERTEKTTLRG